MQQPIDQTVEKIFVEAFAEDALTMQGLLKPKMAIFQKFFREAPIEQVWELQLLSGKSQYFNLYEKHVEQNPSVLLWALFSENTEAICYVMRNYTKLFSGLTLQMPFHNDYRHAFAFPKQRDLLDLVLDSIADDHQKFPRHVKLMQYAITRIFMVMVAVDWWEGVEYLIKRHPDLWDYEMHGDLCWIPPIHFLAIERFEWIEHKIVTNPDRHHLIFTLTKGFQENNMAQVCAGMGSLRAVEWLSHTDMLSLENWNITKAIYLAGHHHEEPKILPFLIDLLDNKINALQAEQFPILLDNLGINDPHIHTAEIAIQKHLLREKLLYKYFDHYNYLTAAWMTGDVSWLKTAIERSMTPDKWIIDQSSGQVLDGSNPVDYKSPQIFFDLLKIHPVLVSLHFINMSFDWHDKIYEKMASLLYLNLLTQVFEAYFSVFNSNEMVPPDVSHYIMAFLLQCIQKEKEAGFHITNSPEERTSIKPAVSSALIKLSFLKPDERYQQFHQLDKTESCDAQPRLPG